MNREINVLWPGSTRQPLLSRGGNGGQDNAFNQLPVLVLLPLFSSDEGKGTYFCLPRSSKLWKKLALSWGSKWRCLARKFVCPLSVWYLAWSNANIKSLHFYINIAFMEIEIALSQPCHLLLYWFPSFGKSLVHFYCDSCWCLFINHLTLTGLPVRSLSIVSASGRMMHGESLGPQLRCGSYEAHSCWTGSCCFGCSWMLKEVKSSCLSTMWFVDEKKQTCCLLIFILLISHFKYVLKRRMERKKRSAFLTPSFSPHPSIHPSVHPSIHHIYLLFEKSIRHSFWFQKMYTVYEIINNVTHIL